MTGTVLTCRAFGRAAIAAGRPAAAVIVSSQMGSVGYPGRAPYCASRHAVNGLTKGSRSSGPLTASASTRLRPRSSVHRSPHRCSPTPFEQEVLSRIPLGRIGEVADVTGAAGFLLSEEASLITGHVLAVDGRWTAQ